MDKNMLLSRLIKKLQSELGSRGDAEVCLLFKGKTPRFTAGNNDVKRDGRVMCFWFNRDKVINNFDGDTFKPCTIKDDNGGDIFTFAYIPAIEPQESKKSFFKKVFGG